LRGCGADQSELRGAKGRCGGGKEIASAPVDVLGHVDLLLTIRSGALMYVGDGIARTITSARVMRFQNAWISASERRDFCGRWDLC
jgi:hypothetical protein